MIPVTLTYYPEVGGERSVTTMLPAVPQAGDSIHFGDFVEDAYAARIMEIRHVRWVYDGRTRLWTAEIELG
jgi:hypothetical protein